MLEFLLGGRGVLADSSPAPPASKIIGSKKLTDFFTAMAAALFHTTSARPVLRNVVPAAPNDIVHVDFKSAPKSRRSNAHILVYVDAFTKYCRLFPSRNCTARAARRAVTQAFGEAGVPNTIVCDGGPAFTDQSFRKFRADIGCKQHVIPPNAHHAIGLAEAFCKTVS